MQDKLNKIKKKDKESKTILTKKKYKGTPKIFKYKKLLKLFKKIKQ